MSRITLKDCCNFQEGYVNPSQKIREFFGDDIKWLRASDLNDGEVFNTERRLTSKGFNSAGKSAFLFKENTLAISKSGTIGRVGILKDKMCGNRAVINIDVNKKIADLYYVFYTLKYKRPEILSKAGGSIQKNLYVSALETISLNHSELSEQSSIAKILSDIDRKIELNKKINTELEAMAKLIYDYWFVQFDFPDASGNPYKSSGGKMVYNQELKREIPEEWDVEIINNIIKVKDGTHDSPKPKDSGYPLITSKHLKPEGLGFDSANLISAEDYESVNKRSKVETGDILFSMIGSIGEIYKVDEQQINFAIKNVGLYKSSEKPEYINYIYMFLKSYDMQRYMGNVTSGSIQKFIGLGALRNMPILINDDLIKKFVLSTEHLFKKKTLIKLENQKLTQLRDWLLPMLMNGQVTVNQ